MTTKYILSGLKTYLEVPSYMNAVGMSRNYGSRQNSTIDSNGKSDAPVRKTNIHFIVYVFLRFTGLFYFILFYNFLRGWGS